MGVTPRSFVNYIRHCVYTELITIWRHFLQTVPLTTLNIRTATDQLTVNTPAIQYWQNPAGYQVSLVYFLTSKLFNRDKRIKVLQFCFQHIYGEENIHTRELFETSLKFESETSENIYSSFSFQLTFDAALLLLFRCLCTLLLLYLLICTVQRSIDNSVRMVQDGDGWDKPEWIVSSMAANQRERSAVPPDYCCTIACMACHDPIKVAVRNLLMSTPIA